MAKITPIVIDFDEPVDVQVNGETQVISQITFARNAKGKDFIRQEKAPEGILKAHTLYASMSGTPVQLFAELDAEEFNDIVMRTSHLMGKSGKRFMDKKRKEMEATMGD